MAQYFTDFTQYPTDETPDDWTPWITASSDEIVVKEALGERYLRRTASGNGRKAYTWNAVPVSVNTEIVAEWGSASDDVDSRLGLRVDPSANTASGDANLYMSGQRGNTLIVSAYINGSYTPLGTKTTPTSGGVRYLTRVRSSGETHQARTWEKGSPEPTVWGVEVVSSGLSEMAGHSGIANFDAGTVDYYWIGIGTEGDPAPTEAPEPGGEGVTVNPPAAETESQSFAPAVTSGASVFPATATTESLAYAPSVTTGTSVSPPVADTIAQAHAPKVAAGANVSPTVAATDSAANDPLVSSGAAIYPPTASTESEAHAPVIATGASVAPPAAFTDSQAHDPIVGSVVIVQPPAAITESLAHDPIISAGASVFPVSAKTVESANDPTISSGASVLVPAAITVTESHDPTVSAGILPFVRKVTIRGTMTRKVTLSGIMSRKASIPGTLTRKVRL